MLKNSYHLPGNISGHSFLVTGGAGFIGSDSVAYLLKHEAKRVHVLDNFSTGFEKKHSRLFIKF